MCQQALRPKKYVFTNYVRQSYTHNNLARKLFKMKTALEKTYGILDENLFFKEKK